jgi:2-polyprenyl-3-methyl-5-hydroxy-6-metoxy-1,4-benzoquinol methylase
MAKAFPKSHFTGFDIHAESIAAALGHAREAGVANVSFEIGAASDYRCVGGQPYDFVAVFDALHDMGDPAAAARHVRDTLAPEGTWMIVEPYAGDRIEENLNPIGRAYYAASTLLCTPCSLSQEGRMGLGAQAGEARLRAVVKSAGFSSFRRALHTPINLILEARP